MASKQRRREGQPVGTPVTRILQVRLGGGDGDDEEPTLVAEVRAALETAGKDGWRAQHALELARRLATRGESGAASLSKELDRVMGELMADVQVETDELDELQGKVVEFRQRRSG